MKRLLLTGLALMQLTTGAYAGQCPGLIQKVDEALTTTQLSDADKAKVVEFCSSTVSRETMEADPHNIVFCPYIISVYVTADEPDKTHIAFRRPLIVGTERSKQSLQAVEDLLKSIIEETLES